MEFLMDFIAFMKVFFIIFAVLYLLKIVYNIAKVAVLREGKVEFGKYGLLLTGISISYIMTVILT